MSLHTIHVTGLPADCSDADVESDLRRLAANICEEPGSVINTFAEPVLVANTAEETVSLVARTVELTSSTADDQVVCRAHVEAAAAATDASEAPGAAADIVGYARSEIDVPVSADASNVVCSDGSIGKLEGTSALLGVAVVRDKKTGLCKGFCFAEFASMEEAEKAIAVLNRGDVQVAGNLVRAELSRPKGDRKKACDLDPSYELEDIPKQQYKKTMPFKNKHRATFTQVAAMPGGLKAEAKRRNATREGKR